MWYKYFYAAFSSFFIVIWLASCLCNVYFLYLFELFIIDEYFVYQQIQWNVFGMLLFIFLFHKYKFYEFCCVRSFYS